jgi:hypothetical protein
MHRPEPNDQTISSAKRGHLTSVICGQSTSVLTTSCKYCGDGNAYNDSTVHNASPPGKIRHQQLMT